MFSFIKLIDGTALIGNIVDESDQTTIDNAIQRIQEVINDIKTNESIDRKELVIEFLEILVEKLNDL